LRDTDAVRQVVGHAKGDISHTQAMTAPTPGGAHRKENQRASAKARMKCGE
jgi:hypothetical protein